MQSPILVILFGSHAKETSHAQSDIDLAILTHHQLTLAERSDITAQYAHKLHVNEDLVYVVDLITASPLLKYEVAQHGKLIEGDAYDFVRFKVHAWKQYLDTAKLCRARAQSLKRYIHAT